MARELNTLEDLFFDQLQDLYDAEQRLMEALPRMEQAATDAELKSAIFNHFEETREHVHRLESIFEDLGKPAKRKSCEAMKGLLMEGEEIISARGDAAVKDAALIAAAQRVEHYEIASYGTARTFAHQLGFEVLAELLQQTLDEEGAADRTLTQIAENSRNPEAASA